jgi:arylsulfatase A-like enzyme
VRGRVDDGAARVKEQLSSWIGGDSEPFFCFVNIVECHSPYLPPRPYAPGSVLERIRAAEDASEHYTLQAIWQTCLGGREVPEGALARLRRQYAASVKYMDAWLGELLETLESRGRLEETIVIVISDHGENFGEGGLIAHSLSLDNRLIHVPFVCSGPVGSVSEIHSLAALPRFIAEAAGVEKHPWREEDLPRGVGVAQHDPPLRRDDPRAAATVIDNWGLGEDALERFTTPLTCAVHGQFKILRRGEDLVWFDLVEDPLELDPRPLADAGPNVASELEALRKTLEDPRVTAMKGSAGSGQPAQSADETADLEEKMRLLGYL